MNPLRIYYAKPNATRAIAEPLADLLSWYGQFGCKPVFVCIGTDRSTGDALGPLVGSLLAADGLTVYGTLDDPVQASNLTAVLASVDAQYGDKAFIVAVDAALGRAESIGMLVVDEGPLQPGTGAYKRLPKVGRVHVTGIVNTAGFMEYFVLQNTRLSMVMRMADVIAVGLRQAAAALDGRR